MRSIAMMIVVTACGAHAAAPAPPPVQPAPAAPAPAGPMSLGAPLAHDFMYAVQGDGVFASPWPHGGDGRPSFAMYSHQHVQVARIDPPLALTDHFEIADDGSITGTAGDGVPRRLTVLVTDPGSLVRPAPRTKAEFLALGDDVLADYVNAWLQYRGFAGGGGGFAGLSQPERDVMWSSVAFIEISDEGVTSLVHGDGPQLPEIRDGLRRVGLAHHADVIDRAMASGLSASDLRALDAAWDAVEDEPVPRVAAYIRAHADDFAWAQMVP